MFTLAHLSDPHLGPLARPRWRELFGKRVTGYVNWRRTRHLVHDPAVLATLVADMQAQHPDHIAVTGDIANVAARAEFAAGRIWLDSLGSATAVSLVPGNHDAYVHSARQHRIGQWGGHMLGDDSGSDFPYLRRRGPAALIGLSTGVPTGFFQATGWLDAPQLTRLGLLLDQTRHEGLFRIVMIHHPPVSDAPRYKRLLDAKLLMHVLAGHGAELLIHGHDHLHMLNWLAGPDGTRMPAVGVPSASAAPDGRHEPAAYNLYRIDGAPGAWTCEAVSRGMALDGTMVEQKRTVLIAQG